MPVIYQKWITRKHLQDNPDQLYLFGDNLIRRGYGGQAKQMRGEPNAVGIPTKKLPSMEPGSFLTDVDYETNKAAILKAVEPVVDALREGRTVVMPEAGIGTFLARLDVEAPRTGDFLKRVMARIVLLGEEHAPQSGPTHR